MSNEMEDWLKIIKKDAKWWLDRYPFFRIKCNDCCPWIEENSDTATWLDELPNGWINGFCEQMCDELMEALGDYVDEWIILQIKEKYGSIRIYHTGCPSDIYNKVEAVISKYENISYHTCCVCGEPATEYSKDWVLPYCSKHIKK